MKFCFLLGAIMALTLTPVELVQAHKVNIFAYAEGDTIVGETSFSGGRPAKQAEVIVEDKTTGEVLMRTRTDDQGAFSFTIPEKARDKRIDLRLVLMAGEGHRNEWLLTAEDYLPAADPPKTTVQTNVTAPPATRSTDPPPIGQYGCQPQDLQAMVEKVVAAQLGPVKKMIAESHNAGPSLQDILGGIGYLFGIFGIIAIIKSKKGGASK